MAKLWVKTLNISFNASGAAAAARQGNVVMVVDVIDMSTTAEAALEAGVLDVLGACPDQHNVPVTVNPEKIGYFAGKKAIKSETGVVIAAEPRYINNDDSDVDGINKVVKGIERAGAKIEKVVSNIGREIVNLVDLENKVLVIVSPSGGAAFDAAYNYGAPEVITGTVARTNKMKGSKPAKIAADRAIESALKCRSGITIVSSSSNSMEDVQAAQVIGQEIIKRGFLDMPLDEE
ncbi:hypothetical protein [Halothermothrix orenii]|uniref:Uncharacterized protein n=1 Tax=Halothermothrix orenii (strain H 168 / OCM 544 / DSM 9562) TaxID=373903 RepID=B8CVX3_HALOH|nr:hypothetical protein [Halothermothrix orenii]ACL69442.1 hypothetical protein Hore_06850 [Halothermothrix orenii H 168]